MLTRFIPILVAFLMLAPAAAAQNTVVLSTTAARALTMTPVATNIAFPMGMTVLPDNSLLVATSPSESGNFFSSTGALVRLVDSDGDGSLDQQTPLVDGLPGSLVAVVRFGDIVVATSSFAGSEQIMFFRRGDHWRDPLSQVGQITLAFNGSEHQSYGLAVRPNTGDPAAFRPLLQCRLGGQ